MTEYKDFKEPKGLPEGWKWVRLGEVCFLSYGKNLSKDKFKDDGKYKVYGANGVIGFYDRYTHSDFTVLVSCRGEYSGVINIAEPYSFITNNSIPLFIKNQKKLDTIFLYYVLKNVPRSKIVSGSAQPQVVISDLKDIFILNPPLPEQRKIAEILETVDNAIEKTEKIIEKYKRIKQGLMQDLLTKGIDENGNIRSEKTHKFKNSPLGRIPEEWEVVRLGEVIYFKNGKSPSFSESGTYPIYGSNGLIGFSNRYQFEGDYLIVGRVGASGEVHLVSGRFFASDNCLVGRLLKEKELNLKYIFYYLKYFDLKRFITQTAQPLITQSLINSLSIPLPPLSEQQRIAEILTQIDQAIEKEEQYKEKLERLKQGLMQDLLNGKVRVNHLIEKGAENVYQT
jgi:type I restriction enzyme S subunit